MNKSLVIVESPAKAKTIGRYLGRDFVVKSSIGHVRDLPVSGRGSKVDPKERARQAALTRKMTPQAKERHKKEKAHTNLVKNMGIDPENSWLANYEILPDKAKIVDELRKSADRSETIYLATDLDREGEAIAWHLMELLKPTIPVKRLAFHEITKSAIQESFDHTRDIDESLVSAQEARRILDRLWGYQVSEKLWYNVKGGLSAGRVQSPAVKIVVDREKERSRFIENEYWSLQGKFTSSNTSFTANSDLPPVSYTHLTLPTNREV